MLKSVEKIKRVIVKSDTYRQAYGKGKYWLIVLYADVLFMYLFYRFNPNEYLYYDFYVKTLKQRRSYLQRAFYVKFLERINRKEFICLARDKGLFLKRMASHIKRDFLDLRDVGIDRFVAFCLSHDRFIAKKYNGASGESIFVYSHISDEKEIRELFDYLKNIENYIVEEYITQHPELDNIYGRAINTLRLITLNTQGCISLPLSGMIRFGMHGREINAPGMEVLVDNNTGYTKSCGYEETVLSESHPDTGVVFQGIKLPYYEEAKNLVVAAAKLMPELPFIGWDIAFTPNGPEIVEGNGMPMCLISRQVLLSSIQNGFGGREEYLKMMQTAINDKCEMGSGLE